MARRYRAPLSRALDGDYAHVAVADSLRGIDRATAGRMPDGAPHSLRQLVQHMILWQEYFLDRIDGEPGAEPDGDPWPCRAAPADEPEWQAALARFHAGLERARAHAAAGGLDATIPPDGQTTRAEALRIVASHTSYRATLLRVRPASDRADASH